jgi:hypothetical protein
MNAELILKLLLRLSEVLGDPDVEDDHARTWAKAWAASLSEVSAQSVPRDVRPADGPCTDCAPGVGPKHSGV